MEELEKKLGKELFSVEDIRYVSDLVNQNIALLFAQECSLKNQKKLNTIQRKINSLNSTEVRNLFKEYQEAMLEDIEQQNCLAYYIGVKKGTELNKVKE